MVGAVLRDQLLPAGRGAGRPARTARGAGDQRSTRHAALPAQPAFPVQHLELDQHSGSAQTDGTRQRDAHPPFQLPAPHAGGASRRQGLDRTGSRHAQALPRHRAHALRRAAAHGVQDRSRRGQCRRALAAAPAAGRERDQVRGLAAGGRRADQPDRASDRQPPQDHRGRHRPRPAGPPARRARLREPRRQPPAGLDRGRPRQHPRPAAAGLRRRSPVRDPHPARGWFHGDDRDSLRSFRRIRAPTPPLRRNRRSSPAVTNLPGERALGTQA